MQKWKVQPSHIAIKSANPIIDFKSRVFKLRAENIIDLTQEKFCAPAKEITDSVLRTIQEGKYNGYAPSIGFEMTRAAILKHLQYPLTPKDVILSSGVSSCLDIVITALADRGQNILISKPGTPHLALLAHGLGIETKEYDLMPDTWEVNLADLHLKIDSKSVAIVLMNPHNPTGVVYDAEHLGAIIELAAMHKLPIILDESYKDMVHGDRRTISAVDINSKVPMLICGGLGQSFMVPGWRVGWILIHDPVSGLQNVRKALISLSQRIIGCNTVVQGAIVQIFNANINTEQRQNYLDNVSNNWRALCREFQNDIRVIINYSCKCSFAFIKINMERFSKIASSTEEFCCKLFQEQGVLLLPGEMFGINGFARVIMDSNHKDFVEFLKRLKRFCDLHSL